MAESGRCVSGEARAAEGVPRAYICATTRSRTPTAIDEALSERMALVRLISSLGRQARGGARTEGPSAAGEGRSHPGRHHTPGMARRARRRDRRGTERKARRVHRRAREVRRPRGGAQLQAARPEARQADAQGQAGLAKQSGSELLANIRDNGQIDLEIDGQNGSTAARRSRGPAITPNQARRQPTIKAWWSCSPPS